MINRLIAWIKANKLSTVLIIIVGYLLYNFQLPRLLLTNRTSSSPFVLESSRGMSKSLSDVSGTVGSSLDFMPPTPNEAPPTDTQSRLVIKDTSLSLLVNDVSQVIGQIENEATRLNGYLVDSSVSIPEGAASGSITIRVPENRRQEALAAFKGFAVKTVSESVSGRDVTDQFVDLDARIATLEKTKTKFESILESATDVQDLLQVQREIINLQSQIDSYKGQQQYLEQSAKLTRITIYLSTDELALPYTPTEAWRPGVIFKTAVRSLVGSLRKLGTAAIWLVVYSPIVIFGYIIWRWVLPKFRKPTLK